MNNSGVAVGEGRTYTLPRRFDAAARWENGAVQNLGKLPTWDLALARGINDNGDIVGVGMAVLNVSFGKAFVWRNGQFTELGSLGWSDGYSIAYAINNAGDIVGSSRRFDNIMHAALWRNGQVIDLGTMAGGTMSEALAVNSYGEAVGYVMSSNSLTYAALFTGGQVIVLPEPPGALSGRTVANGLNDFGQMVGQAVNATTLKTMPILWTVGARGGGGGTTNTTPSASLQATSSTSIRVGRSVSMQASFTDPDNGPWSYKLDWGDGSVTAGNTSNTGTISGISPHVYARTGNFKVKLSVTDSKGAADSSNTISVRVR